MSKIPNKEEFVLGINSELSASKAVPSKAIKMPVLSFFDTVSRRNMAPPRMVNKGLVDSVIEASKELVREMPINRGSSVRGVPSKARLINSSGLVFVDGVWRSEKNAK